MNNPPTMYNRVSFDEMNDNYLFISYSHLDKEEVFKVLNYLYSNQVNYWYDEELLVGDRWDEVVKTKINNPHCVGTIFFLSKNYIISDSCKKEYEEIKKLNNHLIIPILLEGNNVSQIYDETNEKNIKISNKEEDFIFKNNLLFLNIKTNPLDGILKCLINRTNRVINNKAGFINKLLSKRKTYQVNNLYILKLGSFPQKNPIVLNRKANDVVIEDEYYQKYYGCKKDNLFYTFEDIEWRILDVDDEFVYLITHNCILAANGTSKDIFYELDRFYQLAFNDEEKDNITINYLDLKTIEKYKNQFVNQTYEFSLLYVNNYPYSKNIIWVNNDDEIILMNKQLTNKITTIDNYSNVVAGVLPIIKVKIKFIK